MFKNPSAVGLMTTVEVCTDAARRGTRRAAVIERSSWHDTKASPIPSPRARSAKPVRCRTGSFIVHTSRHGHMCVVMTSGAPALWRSCRRCGEGSAVDAELLPGDLMGLHHVADLSLPARQRRASRLDLEEHHPAQLAIVETVEHQQVDRTAEKPGVLGIEPELRQVGHELLVYLAARDGVAPLHRVLSDRLRVARFPPLHVHQGEQQTDRDAEDEHQEQTGEQTGVARHESPGQAPRYKPMSSRRGVATASCTSTRTLRTIAGSNRSSLRWPTVVPRASSRQGAPSPSVPSTA